MSMDDTAPLDSWAKAEAFALSLPGTAQGTLYDMPMVMVAANRRAFLTTGQEPRTSFVILIDEGHVEMLLETDPDSFWQSQHYAGSGAVLVRYSAPDPARGREAIGHAYRLTATKKKRPPRKK